MTTTTTTSHTVGQVATIAGETVRTLHHDDRIGLLTPSERGLNGSRRSTRDWQRVQAGSQRATDAWVALLQDGAPADDHRAMELDQEQRDRISWWFSACSAVANARTR